MKISTLATACCFTALAISCASKKVEELPPDPALQKLEVTKPAPQAQIDKNSKQMEYLCTSGKDERKITIDRTTKRCEVHYTKSGQSNQMAWAEATPSLCDKVFNNIKDNIEKGGFKCADGSEKSPSIPASDLQKTASNL